MERGGWLLNAKIYMPVMSVNSMVHSDTPALQVSVCADTLHH